METPTGQSPELDLHQIHQSHHQEPAPEHRPQPREQHAEPQHRHVHVSLVDRHRKSPALAGLDGLLEGERDEAGEEEGAEGVDVEGDHGLGDGGGGGAGGRGGQRGKGGWVPREPQEDGEGEERVHVHDAVQGHYVHARPRLRSPQGKGGGGGFLRLRLRLRRRRLHLHYCLYLPLFFIYNFWVVKERESMLMACCEAWKIWNGVF